MHSTTVYLIIVIIKYVHTVLSNCNNMSREYKMIFNGIGVNPQYFPFSFFKANYPLSYKLQDPWWSMVSCIKILHGSCIKIHHLHKKNILIVLFLFIQAITYFLGLILKIWLKAFEIFTFVWWFLSWNKCFIAFFTQSEDLQTTET